MLIKSSNAFYNWICHKAAFAPSDQVKRDRTKEKNLNLEEETLTATKFRLEEMDWNPSPQAEIR